MKKHFFIILLFILAISFSESIINGYQRYDNILLTQVNIKTFKQYEDIIKYPEKETSIKDIKMFKEVVISGLKSENRSSEKAKIGYEVTGNVMDSFAIKLLDGRFILETDFENENKFAVISKETAVELFYSEENCVGKELNINGETYEICGVYENTKTLPSKFGVLYAEDTTATFLTAIKPKESKTSENINGNTNESKEDGKTSTTGNNLEEKNESSPFYGSYTIIMNTKPASSTTIITATENYFSSAISTSGKVDIKNIDLEVSVNSQKILIIRMIIFLILAFIILKYLYKDFKKFIENIKEKNEKLYVVELIKINIKYILKKVFIYLAVILILFFIFNKIKFEVMIDPNLIPNSLIDYKDFFEKINRLLAYQNTEINFGTEIEAIFRQTKGILNYLCAIILIISIYYIRKLEKNKEKIFEILVKIKYGLLKIVGISE